MRSTEVLSSTTGQEVENESTIIIENEGTKLTNKRTKGKIEVKKIDKENKTSIPQGDAKIKGTKYELYAREDIRHADGKTTRYEGEEGIIYKAGELVEVQEINEEGKLEYVDLECGKYYIKEKEAGEGYIVDEKEYEVDVRYRGEEIEIVKEERTLEEQVKKQAFEIYKLGEEEGTEYNPLKGAGFSIYQISKLKIVEEGKIERQTKEKYILKDEEAKRDERITKKANKDGTYDIRDLIEYYYKIYEKEGEGGIKVPTDETTYKPYKMEGEKYVKNYANKEEGEEIEEIKTNEEGRLKSPELAYGEYIVIETSVPKEKETARPIIVKIEEDKREAQGLRFIIDKEFEARIKINKKDEETKENIINNRAKYVIRNQETGELETYKTWNANNQYEEQGTEENPFETSDEGYLITPMKLGVGKYEIEEIIAPENYVVNGYEGKSEEGETKWERREKVEFEIIGNTAYHIDEYLGEAVIVENQENEEQVGSLKIETKGEYIKGVEKEEEGYKFIYEKRGIEGAEYEIIAEEEIKYKDGQNKTRYEKGEVVRKIRTNEEGISYIENLEIGEYRIRQTKAGEGFSRNEKEIKIRIEYGTNEIEIENEKEERKEEWKKSAQETPVTYRQIKIEEKEEGKEEEKIEKEEYENERQKIKIKIEKKEEGTGKKLEGGEFGLYNKREIINEETGEILIEENSLIEKATSNEEGIVEFKKDIPLGEYYIKEEKAPKGYKKSEKIIEIKGEYKEDERKEIKIEEIYENEKTEIRIRKVDEKREKLEGAKLEIQTKEGEKIAEIESKKEEQIIRGLESEKEYKVVETKPAKGYVTAEEIRFKLKETGEVEIEGEESEKIEKETNTIIMQDEITRVEIRLVDKDTRENIEGSILRIEKEETREEIKRWETGKEGKEIEKLEIGKYILIEESYDKEKGYVTTKEIKFEVEDKEEKQEVEMEQSVTKIEIHLVEKESRKEIEGGKLELINEAGRKIEEWETKEGGKYIERVPQGKYKIVQKEKPEGKGYVKTKEIEFEIEDKEEIQKIEMEQSITKVKIEVRDEETKEEVEGGKYQLINKETGEIEEEWEQGKTGHKIERIGIGKYIIREIKAATEKGYVRGEDVEIEVEDKEEEQIKEIEEKITKVGIRIVDKEKKEIGIVGARLRIETEEGKEIEEWISDGKEHEIKRVPVGKIIIKQEEAPTLKGYVRIKDMEVEIKEEKEKQEIEIEEPYTKIKIKVIDKTSREEIEGMKIEIREEKGKEIAKWETKEGGQKIQRIGVGKYKIETEEEKEGYKEVRKEIEVKEKEEEEEIIIEVEREKFDIKVEKWIEKVIRNGEEESNKKEEQKIVKVEIKDKKIKTEEIKVVYKIRVSNEGKIGGYVGKIVEDIPIGLEYRKEDNKGYWEEEGGKLVAKGIEGKEIKEGEYVEVEIVLRWKNGIENFGTKTNRVRIEGVRSVNGYEQEEEENDKAEAEVIMGVGTGEIALIGTCLILLWILVPLEIVIYRVVKNKSKSMRIKDKTIRKRK